ncbi:MAG: AAA family ATPase [Deinococcales bacterium]
MMSRLMFIVGLTGVGKSTTFKALQAAGLDFELLPNRRDLTDKVIIPQMQKALGWAAGEVRDRVMRFELTKAYRERHPKGMAKVVKDYLDEAKPSHPLLVFDNLRGENEVGAALELFAKSYFIMLDAPEEVRLRRILGRQDSFDQVSSQLLKDSENLPEVEGISPEELKKALSIIQSEKENYDAVATAKVLKERCAEGQLLYLDTSLLSIDEVSRQIQMWLREIT